MNTAPRCLPPVGDVSLRSATDLAGAIAAGAVSAAEIAKQTLDRIAYRTTIFALGNRRRRADSAPKA